LTRKVAKLTGFLRLADRLSLAAAYLAAACLAALIALLLAEIALGLASRLFRGLPGNIPIAWEYSAYLMGASFLLGSALTLRVGMQVRVELLLRAGKGRFERILELVCNLIGVLITAFLAITLARFTLQSYLSGQVSTDSLTPLWIPQAVLTLGAMVLAVQMIARLLAWLTNQPLNDPKLGATSALAE
jgi:TRAP-type mannitol/chloroaromatic compound transport system permease small subunit